MIIQADILTWAATYDGPKFHALLCDAPYHLTEITARFGAEDAAPAQYGKDGAFQRLSKGFMGKRWDGVDEDGIGIAFNPEMWRAVAQHLHPGAYLFVFAGTLNDDLISMAMRAAGLRKHHKGLAWGYGSGFPKATNTADQIDAAAFRDWLDAHPREAAILKSLSQAARVARKARQPYKALESRCKQAVLMLKRRAGLLPHVVGTRKHAPKFDAAGHGYREKDNGYNSKERESFDVTAPATELAQTWAGHRYGLQALKPAVEPILIFQKPYAGSAIDSITATGAGALNIDQARISMQPGDQKGEFGPHKPEHLRKETTEGVYGNGFARTNADQSSGRWPANLVLSHSPSCNGTCAPECPVAALGAQSGESEYPRHKTKRSATEKDMQYSGGYSGQDDVEVGFSDRGTAARFFFNADYLYERLEDADAVIYEAKASKGEREAGLDPRQLALLNQAEIEAADPTDARYHHRTRQCNVCGTKANNGKGSTACGHDNWAWVKQEVFAEATINDGREKPIDNPYQRGETTRRNIHPTIKPIALARHLATLLLPPDAYAPRRLLIPFAGAGSEMIGALLAGWDEVVGVELEADHVAIAQARLAYWRQRLHEFGDPAKDVRATLSEAPAGQIDMFEETRS